MLNVLNQDQASDQ